YDYLSKGAFPYLTKDGQPFDDADYADGKKEFPRPIGSALTGTHAHLALLEFWHRRQWELSGRQARAARTRLHRYGRQVARALWALRAHPALTPSGADFVAGMADEAARCGFPARSLSAVRFPARSLPFVRPDDPSPVGVAPQAPIRTREPAASSPDQATADFARDLAHSGRKKADEKTPGVG
ncbi:HEXXH motif-containing putative peptide modification protein, partial [Streptomyces sp. NPDC005921]